MKNQSKDKIYEFLEKENVQYIMKSYIDGTIN